MRVDQSQIVNSALWAAYGDAVGFITELAESTSLVKRRAGVSQVSETIEWKRKIGGQYGALAQLPAGCYSDDTQLRLSTCRSLLSSGKFDVEAFSKIELPIWLSYALGAGRGSKTAASQLTQASVNWNNNFFDVNKRSYFQCGGNGAAMRIQPHVWVSSSDTGIDKMVLDVIRNSVSTHGHARGILGAVFHANCLDFALKYNELPPPDEWHSFIRVFSQVPLIMEKDTELTSVWLPVWEEENNGSFGNACQQVANECEKDIIIFTDIMNSGGKYRDLVSAIGGLEDQSRGSGTKTALLAMGHAWMHKRTPVKDALLEAANLLNSDTDTIATMSGALLGCVTATAPTDPLQDRKYIEQEATRCWKIRTGQPVENFKYPDVFGWKPPKTQIEVVRSFENKPFVIGLGKGSTLGEVFISHGKKPSYWQWIQLDFGQSVLCKRREKPESISEEHDALMPSTKNAPAPQKNPERSHSDMKDTLFDLNASTKNTGNQSPVRDVHFLTNEAIHSKFDPTIIGQNLLELIQKENSVEAAIGYAAIIAKAIASRKDRNGNSK